MRFDLTDDQRAFAGSLDALVAASDPVGVARAWATEDTAPGLRLWARLAGQGVHALLVPEEDGGMGATAVELVVAMEVLGRYAVPGPWVESVAYLPTALSGSPLAALAEGVVATVAVPPHVPLALDADVAEQVWLATTAGITSVGVGRRRTSVDRSRRLFEVDPGPATPAADGPAPDRAFDLATVAAAAYLLGAGERVLADTVTYVKQRRQFGREIGSFQAIKHALADARIALDFARPLVFGAALDPTPRATSAAKVAAGDAAYLASRTGLQAHGAVGYTQELDLSIHLTKIRALVGAWGTPTFHRGRILEMLTSDGGAR